MRPRAVIFDLWQTLVRWRHEESDEFRRRWSESLGVSAAQLDALWYDADTYRGRESGPIRTAIAALCQRLDRDADIEEVLRWRLDLTRRALTLDAGVAATLSELRRRGIATGLISNCTEDVPLVWDESPFAGLIDVTVFSATAGCVKPDPRIYELATDTLEVESGDCLFVGDGANDELGGAERVGMTPVLIHLPGEQPPWDGLQNWPGLRITSIPQVLELVA